MKRIDIPRRLRSSLRTSEDKSTATVSYTFRGVDEAEKFKKLVDNFLINACDFISESDFIDGILEENNCAEF